MSYINQDPDIFADTQLIVPFKGKQVVSTTQRSWMEMMDYHQGQAACWCGDTPGLCVDCREDHANTMMGKIHIGSGEDNDCFR